MFPNYRKVVVNSHNRSRFRPEAKKLVRINGSSVLFVSAQKLEEVKMFSLAISEATVGLPLSIYVFQQHFAVVKSQEDQKDAPLFQGTGYRKISKQMKLKWVKLKREKFSNYLISKESHVSLSLILV